MGLAFSSLYQWIFGGNQFKIVMVGLDNAGKSTILYRLCVISNVLPNTILSPRALSSDLGIWEM